MTPRELIHKQWGGASLIGLIATLIAIGAGVGSCASIVAAKVGISVSGTPEAFAAVDTRVRVDSTYVNARVTVNDQRIYDLNQRMEKIERVVEIWTYIQCAQMRNARPRSCTEVLSQ